MKKIIIIMSLVFLLFSCGEEKNENKILKTNVSEVKKEEIKKKIDIVKEEKKEEEKKQKKENKNGNIHLKLKDKYIFCKKLLDKKLIKSCSLNIGKENIPNSDNNPTFSIIKFGTGELINQGDFIGVKNIKLPLVVGEVGNNFSENGGVFLGINAFGLPLGTEGFYNRQKIILDKKLNKKEFLSKFVNLMDKAKISIVEKKKTLESIENDIKNRFINQDYSIGLGYGLYFSRIILGEGFNNGDSICIKNEVGKFSKSKIKNPIFVVGKLGVGTKFRQYYNGGNGGELLEIVNMMKCSKNDVEKIDDKKISKNEKLERLREKIRERNKEKNNKNSKKENSVKKIKNTVKLVEKIKALSNLDIIDMQYFSSDKYFVLTSETIYIMNNLNKIIKKIKIDANNPKGFSVDINENIFIANTGDNKIIKLLKSENYKKVFTFGIKGAKKGELNNPLDLVANYNSDNGKIYILDAGNNRIQVFDYSGKYIYSFDGSTTPNGKLNNPTRMVGYFGQPLTIVDAGNNIIRTIQCSQGQKEHEIAVIKDKISSNIGKITTGGHLIVPDKNNKSIFIFQNKNYLKKTIKLEKKPNIVISGNFSDFLVTYGDGKGLWKISIYEDEKGEDPIGIVKQFIKAVLQKNKNEARKFLIYGSYLDKIFINKDSEKAYINMFNSIISWKKVEYSLGRCDVIVKIKANDDEWEYVFHLYKENGYPHWLIKKSW